MARSGPAPVPACCITLKQAAYLASIPCDHAALKLVEGMIRLGCHIILGFQSSSCSGLHAFGCSGSFVGLSDPLVPGPKSAQNGDLFTEAKLLLVLLLLETLYFLVSAPWCTDPALTLLRITCSVGHTQPAISVTLSSGFYPNITVLCSPGTLTLVVGSHQPQSKFGRRLRLVGGMGLGLRMDEDEGDQP
ncbi:unnamed protein product [Pleuronectes platessa]|uniref:Uncharacterized protein n=1 Tax=Pleuronectes platessa TaxID=8262 RepID=A0A9N7V3A7_PLEPL|nr:unnamed protein product [Pleuronectes platessa]